MDRKCREFRNRYEDLEGRIPDDASGDALRAHSASCPSCTSFLADRRALQSALRPLERARAGAVPSDDLAERIVARIQREAVETSTRASVPFFLRSSTRRVAPVAVTLAVFLAFGVFASLVASGMIPTASPAASLTPGAKNDAFAPEATTGKPSGNYVDDQTGGTASEGLSADSRLVLTGLDMLPVSDVKAAAGSTSTYAKLVASGALGTPSAFRGYENKDGSLTLLLLYPSGTIQDRADSISAVLAPCASPFRIEIIDGKDIGSTFTALGLSDADAFLSGHAGTGYRLLMVDLGR